MWPTTWLSLSFMVEKGREFDFVLKFILICFSVRPRPEFHPPVSENMAELIDDPATSTIAPSSYNAYGRIYQRQTSPFIALSTIVVAGIRHETADSDDEATDDKSM